MVKSHCLQHIQINIMKGIYNNITAQSVQDPLLFCISQQLSHTLHIGTLFYACYSGAVRTDIIRNSFFFHNSKSFSQLLTFCFLFLYSGTAAVIYIISKTFRTLSMRKGT